MEDKADVTLVKPTVPVDQQAAKKCTQAVKEVLEKANNEEGLLTNQIVKFIRENSPVSLSKVCKSLNVHKRFVEPIMKSLAQDGIIEYSGGRMWKYNG